MRLDKVTAAAERSYEKQHIALQRDRYMSTDVIRKVSADAGYAEKVRQIENALGGTKGWVLDIGANTCGESEFITTHGYNVIATDINEIALGISKARCAKFNRKSPQYVACDGHKLALADNSIDFVILNEALHHMEFPLQTLRETSRVLVPGGRVFLYEPYAFNPYRRVSEIRDRFQGTIERSFSISQLKRLLAGAGLLPVLIDRHVYPPSDWKMEAFGRIHKFLRRAYYRVSTALPKILGNLMVIAEKPGKLDAAQQRDRFELLLRCPITGMPVIRTGDGGGYITTNQSSRLLYPSLAGIPVLIREEARILDESTWRESISRAHQAIALPV
jgi:ubiquinone/menaquinone biosynthesis C-methylase UbiE